MILGLFMPPSTRLRTKYDFSFPWIIYYILYDVGDIIMMRKCMLGIKERAENHIRNPILENSRSSKIFNRYQNNYNESVNHE
ncbi:hypothetical protein Cha6605_1142 [Chamaesiphon minutus PCC 6605]|uniref:Uncharacterized protein n=1 Tax=Chamaesiphon minutus (strain ATCC 27169 / PCC 6605) TaxID=1173020 RepID=K9UC23_CHAP6|nr:hypothetical protein Cha6605_1142 [Chamaesiphon minutus PCC 6605]